MRRLRDLPIKLKLRLAILATCFSVLILASIALVVFDAITSRRTMVRDMTVLADVLGRNTQAALAFLDDGSARRTLLALEAETHVVSACVYDPSGNRFAEYLRRKDAPGCPARPAADGHRFESRSLGLFRPVVLDGERIGTIHLRADLDGIYDRLRLFGGIAALILFGSSLVAFVLSARLERPFSRPILALAATAKAVAEGKDSSVRAVKEGQDEVGALTDAFNQMLTVIEEREGALVAANLALHEEIGERKHAEGRVEAQLARLELLQHITRAIGERHDLSSIFQVVVRSLEDHLAIDFGCICLAEEANSALRVLCVGAKSRTLAEVMGVVEQSQVPVDENGLSSCMRGNLVYEPDVSVVPFPFPERLTRGGLRSLVAAPLAVESKVFGVLVAARRRPESFSSPECEFLRQLSEHVALASHQSQLHGALQQAYDDLRQTQQAVLQQERLRALGQMASGIAHDINNAISPVALYTESLLETEPNLSAKTRDYLQTIQQAVEDVQQTVGRMREFYRQREPQLNLTPVDLNRVTGQVGDLTRARWHNMPQQRGVVIELRKDLTADLPTIMGVESEIREALTNLVFNAVDAMPEGGTLTLRTRRTGANGGAAGGDDQRRVVVEVGDTGAGMDDETRRRCLEPFFTTKGERGTGLGLAMVYGIVQRHSADIEIDSTPGQGTTVRLAFAEPSAVVDSSSHLATARPPRMRLLIVDDDPLLIKSLRDTLEADGHDVRVASGGREGLDAFRAAQRTGRLFDAVVTDLGMPYVDGRQVAEAIKRMAPATPVILLTGWGQRLLSGGDVPPHVDRVLGKPPKLRELREALAQCHAESRAADIADSP